MAGLFGSKYSLLFFLIVLIMAGGTQASFAAAPTISGTPRTSVDAGTWYKFIPTAADADGDTLTFSVANLPSWAGFVPSRGEVWGRPGAGDDGTFWNIRISVTDGLTTRTLPSFSITVNGVGASPPTISGTPRTSVDAGTWYKFIPTAADADGDTLRFSVANLPSWAGFVPSRGEVWGRPGAGDAGTTSNIRISVTDGLTTRTLPSFSITVNGGGSSNSAPRISGAPRTNVDEGMWYSFVPTATDADGDSLTFSIANLPSWASFVPSRGEVWGRPGPGAVGTYGNIRISVSDGSTSVTLPAFSIRVNAASSASGSATLSWDAPTQYEDGSPLTDLAGYRLFWGTTSGNYTSTVTINNPGLMTYVVDNLNSGMYYFSVKAFNSQGAESRYAGEVSKRIP